ncbi:MAG: bifunctional UDP-N-acetylmuramoyl-tripeptide:D-alanyl-D-alanine ligase/alanine racemase, partial [Bacteroidaceae bacterium]
WGVRRAIFPVKKIAKNHKKNCHNATTIGISGSNGKTIVKEWLYQLIGDQQTTIRSPKSYNSQIGVPLSLLLYEENTQLAIIEAGISMPGEMDNLANIIDPDIAIFTNIGSAHRENFSSPQQKASEKLKLATRAKKIIFPADDEFLTHAIETSLLDKTKLLGWSTDRNNQLACFFIESIVTDNLTETTTVTLFSNNNKKTSFTIPFIDNASVQNSITAFVAATVMGYDINLITKRMEHLEPVAMRLEVKEGQRELILINDTYNSDINSLSIALDFMSRRKKDNTRPSVVILSDLVQGGHDKDLLYKKAAELIDMQGINRLIAVGPELQEYASLFNTPIITFRDTDQLIASPMLSTLHDSDVLIKGSRRFEFDRITSLLEKRVHETILEVNLNAIADNLNHYRSMMKPNEKIVCMVKAAAYGAGSIEVCKTLQDHKADFLAVAVADEGVALRQGGIRSRIMIMNPEMTAFHDLFEYRLEPEVYNFRLLEELIKTAEKTGITDFPIHIKLDTGMHRLGFNPETDIKRLIEVIHRQHALKICSIFSHFVGSDGEQFDDFTHRQFNIFDKASKQIQNAFNHRILRHICNSAGIERFPQYHLDMVRLGIGLYGINPFTNKTINTVSTLKTTILQIRDVTESDTVGYSRKGVLTRPSRIAAIPIGYADGLNRHLGCGNGYCLVNGEKAYYVGNICMDVCMIDVTNINCKEGDSVEIFGTNLPVTELSNKLGTIPYEILTSVSERVKRVYFG